MLDAYGSGSVGSTNRNGNRSSRSPRSMPAALSGPVRCNQTGERALMNAFSSANAMCGRVCALGSLPMTPTMVSVASSATAYQAVGMRIASRPPSAASGRSKWPMARPLKITASRSGWLMWTTTEPAMLSNSRVDRRCGLPAASFQSRRAKRTSAGLSVDQTSVFAGATLSTVLGALTGCGKPLPLDRERRVELDPRRAGVVGLAERIRIDRGHAQRPAAARDSGRTVNPPHRGSNRRETERVLIRRQRHDDGARDLVEERAIVGCGELERGAVRRQRDRRDRHRAQTLRANHERGRARERGFGVGGVCVSVCVGNGFSRVVEIEAQLERPRALQNRPCPRRSGCHP